MVWVTPLFVVLHLSYNTYFSVENENLVNKKDEPAVPNSARERRLVLQMAFLLLLNVFVIPKIPP